MRRTPKLLAAMAVALGALLGSVLTGPLAGARSDPAIATNQPFLGLVNAKQPTATIEVLCPGPANSGHPLADQTVAVSRAPSAATSTGFTGSRGRSVVAGFGGPATNAQVTFSTYRSRPIPTSLVLPCSGTGTVVFSPRPTSKTALASAVTVTYLNLGAAPPEARSSRTVTVTDADNGRHITLHKADLLEVKLSGLSAFTWTEPASSDRAVLRRQAGSSGRAAGARFLALSTGTATVTATDVPNCYPHCAVPVRSFAVDVSVAG
jgi:hypothetical protein